MTKEMVKGIRLVCGFTDKLYVHIPCSYEYYTAQHRAIMELIEKQFLEIYGPGIYDKLGVGFNPQPGITAKEYVKVFKFISSEAMRVCLGQYDKE